MKLDELLVYLKSKDVRLCRRGAELVIVGNQPALTATLINQLREHKSALLEMIGNDSESLPAAETPVKPLMELGAEDTERIAASVPGGAANVQDIYPLAPLQEGILFHHLVGEEGDPYLLAWVLSFESRIHLDRYLKAMQAVIDRHDILRTAIAWEGLPEPVQVVWRKAVLPVEEVVLGGNGDAVTQLYERYSPRHYRMDVRQAPLLRAVIAHDEQNGRWLMMQMRHHLSGYHATSEGMYREIQAHLLGEADRLPTPLPFRNLVVQARLGVSEQEHEAFFRQMLGDVEEPTAPFGLLNVQLDGTGIEQEWLRVGSDVAGRIRGCARKLGVSAASLFHLAWAQVLARVSGREDVVFGTVLLGRMQGGEGSESVMGLFMNTLPVRIRAGVEGVEAGVLGTHRLLAELLRHEHASLALAQRCSAVPAPQPLFSALLNYRHTGGASRNESEDEKRAWAGIEVLYGEERTNYPVTLSVDDTGDGFALKAQVETSVGARRICEYMQRTLESLVEALERKPSQPVRTLDVLPEAEQRQMVAEWNATAAEYPKDKGLQELIAEQAVRTPDAVAVAGEEGMLSYGELNRRAERLARELRRLGVQADTRVAICVERGPAMLVGMLGVWKAGGAYVPLDPGYPAERLKYMVEDSAPAVLLTQSGVRKGWEEIGKGVKVVEISGEASTLCDEHGAEERGQSGKALAYVIYTSGSTGVPKGAMVEQAGMVNHACAKVRDLKLSAADVVAQTASQCFDISVWQYLAVLLVGGKVEIIGDEDAHDPLRLWAEVEKRGVSVLETVPSMLESILEAMETEGGGAEAGAGMGMGENGLRWVVVTGEACPVELWRRWTELESGIGLMNAYGPTECSDDVTHYEMGRWWEEHKKSVPIGGPVSNTGIYVVDEGEELLAAGVIGELWIGGAGVGRGYWKAAGLTAERFVADRFGGGRGERLYRTGDLGRWNEKGELEFVGRKDQQVKVRGYRIELGEIEARLTEHPGVGTGVVVARDEEGQKRLVAYYTRRENRGAGETGAEQLRGYLAERLPEYMVPAAYVEMEKLPLTANGKLDRKGLPAPEAGAFVQRGYEEPVGETVRELAAIWAEVLRIERVGRHDNFFDLGGHSLLVVRVISRVRKRLETEAAIGDLFTHPVLADFAGKIAGLTRSALPAIVPAKHADVLSASFAQQRLWFLSQLEGVSRAYHIFLGLRLKGPLVGKAMRDALDRIVARHAILRTTFVCIEGEPMQRIAPAEQSRFHLLEHDLSATEDDQQRGEELQRLIAAEA